MMNFRDIIRLIFSKDNKEALYVGIGNLFSSAIGAIFWLLLASLVDANIYGEVNYYIALATLSALLSLIGLDIPSITYLARGEENLFREATILILIVSIITSIILGLILSNISVGLLVIGNNLYAMTATLILGKKRYNIYPIFMLVLRISQLLFAIILYFIIDVYGIILGYAIPPLVLGSLLFNNIKNICIIRDAIKFTYLKKKIRFVINTYIFQLSNTILYIDKLVIAPLFGFAILGLYQFAFQLLIFLSMIPMSLIQYLLPQEASSIDKKNIKLFGIVLSAILSLLLFFIFPLVIEIYFKAYEDAIDVARIMAFGIIPMTLNAILNAEFLGRERSFITMIGSLTYIFSLILLILLLGNLLGLIGLAISTLSAIILQTIVLLFFKLRFKE